MVLQRLHGEMPGKLVGHVGRVKCVGYDAIPVNAPGTEHVLQDRLWIGDCCKLLICGKLWLLEGFRDRRRGGGTAHAECLRAQAAEPAASAYRLAQVIDFIDSQPVQKKADLTVRDRGFAEQ